MQIIGTIGTVQKSFHSNYMYDRKLLGIIKYASKDETPAVMIEKVGHTLDFFQVRAWSSASLKKLKWFKTNQ